MITPKEFGLAVRGLEKALGQFFELRGCGLIRVQDNRTAIVRVAETDHLILLADAFSIALRQTCKDPDALKTVLESGHVEGWMAATHTQYQAKRISAWISRRRIQQAPPEERRVLIEILAYARATRAFGNRNNGLVAAIQTLQSLDRLPILRGTLAVEIENWEKCLGSIRRRAHLLRKLRRIERELHALEAC